MFMFHPVVFGVLFLEGCTAFKGMPAAVATRDDPPIVCDFPSEPMLPTVPTPPPRPLPFPPPERENSNPANTCEGD